MLHFAVCPKVLTVTGPSVPYVENRTITLTCSVDKTRPIASELIWRFLDEGTVIHGNIESNIHTDDEDTYNQTLTADYEIQEGDNNRNIT